MNIHILISISYDSKKDRHTASVRGLYTSLELAQQAVAEFADDITEGGYFNFFLIEERLSNCLDCHSTWETWYQVHTSMGRNHFVEAIKKPDMFQNYSNFV
jgi:hypothetical protein